jgi:hypothetical protein
MQVCSYVGIIASKALTNAHVIRIEALRGVAHAVDAVIIRSEVSRHGLLHCVYVLSCNMRRAAEALPYHGCGCLHI